MEAQMFRFSLAIPLLFAVCLLSLPSLQSMQIPSKSSHKKNLQIHFGPGTSGNMRAERSKKKAQAMRIVLKPGRN